MVFRGHVGNGVVVLDPGVFLPEGQEVTVQPAYRNSGVPFLIGSQQHSVLDIPPVSLGSILRQPTTDDDLLGEMLDGRK